MMEARPFLEAVAGYTRDSVADQAENAPVKIGTIDAAYSGTGFAKVKFDGESITSTKAYPFLESYFPVPGDRVVLLPVGNTLVIQGRIDQAVNNLVKRVAALEGNAGIPHSLSINGAATAQTIASGTGSGAYADMTNFLVTGFVKKLAATVVVVDLDAGGFATVASSEFRFGVNVNGTDFDVVNVFSNPAATHLVGGGSVRVTGVPAGTYTIQARWRRVSGTATVISRNASDWNSMRVIEEWA